MKVEICCEFSHGYRTLQFNKIIELPFQPFYNMSLEFKKDGLRLELNNNDYTKTIIEYELWSKCFFINIRENWKNPSIETLDETIEMFKDEDWRMNTNESIKEWKNFISHKEES